VGTARILALSGLDTTVPTWNHLLDKTFSEEEEENHAKEFSPTCSNPEIFNGSGGDRWGQLSNETTGNVDDPRVCEVSPPPLIFDPEKIQANADWAKLSIARRSIRHSPPYIPTPS
jgi:hypothetical protein